MEPERLFTAGGEGSGAGSQPRPVAPEETAARVVSEGFSFLPAAAGSSGAANKSSGGGGSSSKNSNVMVIHRNAVIGK